MNMHDELKEKMEKLAGEHLAVCLRGDKQIFSTDTFKAGFTACYELMSGELIKAKKEIVQLRVAVQMFYNYTTPEDCPTPHAMALELMPELSMSCEAKKRLTENK